MRIFFAYYAKLFILFNLFKPSKTTNSFLQNRGCNIVIINAYLVLSLRLLTAIIVELHIL